jgi:hypothetical protein
MRWAGHVAHMGEKMHARFCSENLEERDHSKDLGIDERKILE